MYLVHFLLATLLTTQQNPASSDEVLMKDGTRAYGRLVSWNQSEVVFRTSDGEILHWGLGEISRLNLGEASVQRVADMLPEPPPPTPDITWEGTTDAGYSGKRGSVDSDSLALAFQGERRSERHRLKLNARYFYATQDEILSGNKLTGGARLDRFTSPRFFIFGSGDIETNEVERVDLRATVAAGIGFELLSSEERRLSLSAGAGTTREDFTDGTGRNSGSGLFNQEYRQKILAQSELEQKFRYLQDLAELGRFKVRLEGTFRTKLNSFLNFSIGVVDAYDNQPPMEARKNELTFLTGFGLVF